MSPSGLQAGSASASSSSAKACVPCAGGLCMFCWRSCVARPKHDVDEKKTTQQRYRKADWPQSTDEVTPPSGSPGMNFGMIVVLVSGIAANAAVAGTIGAAGAWDWQRTANIFAILAFAMSLSWFVLRHCVGKAPGTTTIEDQSKQSQQPQQIPQEEGLDELRKIWDEEIKTSFPEVEKDLYLSPPADRGGTDGVLSRFLRAERNQRSANPVRSAADRLRETAEWRREYSCMDFHRKGMARRLCMHASNPGASVYFADIGLRDSEGEPVLVGRSALMTSQRAPGRKPSDNMLAATHLRACMFVCERAALETRTKGSYILDLGDYPTDDMAKRSHRRFWDADGVIDDGRTVEEGVKPHLPQHRHLEGLSVLKESMRMMQTYYPELLKKVYFYQPPFWFRAVFNIFRLWVPADTRERFVIVKKGDESKHFLKPGVMNSAEVPVELGGTGTVRLDGDGFLSAAVKRYDSEARLDS